ncbi:MAG: diguanylate cyclase [Spirochaetes bacterium]|nr:diguanylate cyclase [Spirochaetota bacterium]
MKKVFISLTLLLSIHISAAENRYIFDKLNRDDGLSDLSVSGIVQDKQGFLWFSTQGGLNRYDGKSFKIYRNIPFEKNTLPHQLIQTMYLDYDNSILWLGTYNGLSRFDIDTQMFTNYFHKTDDSQSLSNEVVTAVCKDADGAIWAGTLDGLNRLNTATGEIKRYYMEPGNSESVPHNIIRSIIRDKDNRIWIGTYNGICRYDRETDSFRRCCADSRGDTLFKSKFVMDMQQDEDGIIWIGNYGTGLVRFDPEKNSFTTIPFKENNIYKIEVREKNTIWIATWGNGLIEYNTQKKEQTGYRYSYTDKKSISHDIIYSLFRDNTNILWIGTNGNGINKLNRNKIDRRILKSDPQTKNSLSRGKANAILSDSFGDMWIGIYGGGLNRFIPSQNRVIRYKNIKSDISSLSNDVVTSVFEDSDLNIWIGTNNGLNLFNRSTGSFKRFLPVHGKNSISGTIINHICEDSEKNLWFGTYRNGLNRLDRETGSFTVYKNDPDLPGSIGANLVYCMIIDSEGRLWIATNKGLSMMNKNGTSFVNYFHNPEDRTSITNNSIRTLFEDSKKRLWLGTTGGGLLFYNNDGKFTHYTIDNGLSDNAINSITEDNNGNLWIGTSYGLNIFNPETKTFKLLTEKDGLWGMEFDTGIEKDSNGNIYLGSQHGIYKFSSNPEFSVNKAPKVILTDILLFNKPLISNEPYYNIKELKLKYNENFLTFIFSANDYKSPAQNSYAYRMDGIDKEWIFSGNRNSVTYSTIAPGKYTFRIKASNSDDIWTTEEKILSLIIKRPPWSSWYAYIFYILISAIIIYALIVIKSKSVLKAKVLELEETEIKLKKLNEELRGLTVIDSLTEIYNRRYLDIKYEAEWEHSTAYHKSISLIIIDIDDFKAYNDNYGHQAGDEVIRKTAAAVKNCLRQTGDIVARYGGEEFCVLMPDTRLADVEKVTKRCIEEVKKLNIEHLHSTDEKVVTISAGASSVIPERKITRFQFFEGVDKLLYESKNNGKNRYTCRYLKL